MKLRSMMAGTLGLLLALVWAMAFLYQRHNLDFLMAAFVAADAPAAVKVSSLWSVLQIVTTALLVLPVAVASIGTMFGGRSMVRVLRVAVAASAFLSAGILVIYAGFAVPRVVSGGPALLGNSRIYVELLVALGTLGLQIVLLSLCRASGSDTPGALKPSLASDEGQKPNEALPPSSRDAQLAALPVPPLAARG